MKSMFWTNEKLSLIVAWSSSVSISCSKVQSSEGNSWCPCSSAHEIHELSEWSDILSWDLEHNLPQFEVISIVGCSAFTELSPSLGSFIELWNISFGFLSILSPSDENIDLRQAFQFHILMTPNKRNLKTILSMQWFCLYWNIPDIWFNYESVGFQLVICSYKVHNKAKCYDPW